MRLSWPFDKPIASGSTSTPCSTASAPPPAPVRKTGSSLFNPRYLAPCASPSSRLSYDLRTRAKVILRHSAGARLLSLGDGTANVENYPGERQPPVPTP